MSESPSAAAHSRCFSPFPASSPLQVSERQSFPHQFTGTIFCLMGKSATGKDTIYAKVQSRLERDGIPVSGVITYTTRPRRAHEIDGDEYYFLDSEELAALEKSGKVLERRDYDTEYGLWSYATIDDGQIHGDNRYIVIGTPEMLSSLVNRFGGEHIVPIMITIDDGTRLMRALTREMQQEKPKYDEMCRRYLSDKRDFADIENRDDIAVFANREIEQCSGEIVNFIKKEFEI